MPMNQRKKPQRDLTAVLSMRQRALVYKGVGQRKRFTFYLDVMMPMASLITLRNVRFDGFDVVSLCQVLQASYITPGLGEGAAVNFVSVYEIRDEAAQIISLAFSAVA